MVMRSKLDRVVQGLIPPSLILLLVATIVELFYSLSSTFIFALELFDAYVIIIFAIDLYYRWQDTPSFFPYVKKHWLDILATIPFTFIFWGVEGLALLQGFKGLRWVARAAKSLKAARLTKLTRMIRLVRFGARAPRIARLSKNVKAGKIRKVQPHETKMKGVLSFKVILLITINSIMGTGIWFLTSAGAKYAGPASLISWAILSVISIYIAMCFSELTAMFPKAGGVYEFAKQTYGRFWSFVIGWTTAIAGSVTIAMLLLGALQYLIPIQYSAYYVPIAIGLLLIFSFVAFKGLGTSTWVLVTFALITLASVIGIIIPGLFNVELSNFDPFFVFPSMSVVLAIFFIAETFFGWESAIFLAAETKDPKKVMPKALIWGTVVISILEFLLAFTAMGTIPWADFAESSAPLRDLGQAHFGNFGGIAFMILIFISVIGAVAGWIVTAPRLFMAIAEDKLFFVQFARVHPKTKSPYVSIAFQFFLVSALVIVGAGSYETLLHMLIPMILVVYSAVMLSVVVLRYKKPDMVRPYRVKFGKVGPLLTIGFMIFLLVMFIQQTHGALDILRISGSLILFGIPAYFAIELFYDQKYVVMRKNMMAKLRSKLNLGTRLRPAYKLMLSYANIKSKDIVVDSNSPTGAVTNRLIMQGVKKVYFLSSSKEERDYVEGKKIIKVAAKEGTIPAKLKGANVFLSYNDLGYVADMEIYLAKVRKLLGKNGRFCFYMTYNSFSVPPNLVDIETKSEMVTLFKKMKMKMTYRKVRFPFRRDIFIYGKVK